MQALDIKSLEWFARHQDDELQVTLAIVPVSPLKQPIDDYVPEKNKKPDRIYRAL
jgi:hypothetical protein